MKYFLVLIIFMVSCQTKPDYLVSEEEKAILKTQIDLIRSKDDLSNYLRSTYKLDQEVRTKSSQVLQEYGPESAQYKHSVNRLKKSDMANLERIELIIQRFGYPKRDSVGRDGANTAILIIHQSADLIKKEQYFPILYQEYIDKNIDEDLFSLYLEKAYQDRFDKRFDMPIGQSFRISQQVDTLIQILNWQADIDSFNQED